MGEEATKGTVEPSTSGTAVRDLGWALGEIAGRERVQVALARLPREVREAFVHGPAMPWVPLRVTTAVVDAIAAEAGLDAEDLVDRAIRRSTERTLSTVWRVLLRFTSDKAILDRTPMMWERTRNVGRLEVVSLEPGCSVLKVEGWPGMPQRHARILAINIETVLQCAGRECVRCHWKRTPDGAVYQTTWRA